MSRDYPTQMAEDLISAGSRWAEALRRFIAAVDVYHSSNAIAPSEAAKTIWRVLHMVTPPDELVFNMSHLLRLASWLPQSILDSRVRRRQLGVALRASRDSKKRWHPNVNELSGKHA